MLISFKMNDNIYFISLLYIQVSVKQTYKDSLFAQISFFGPTMKILIHKRESNY